MKKMIKAKIGYSLPRISVIDFNIIHPELSFVRRNIIKVKTAKYFKF